MSKPLTLTLILILHAVVRLPTLGMNDRLRLGCDVRIVRGDPSLATCVICKRVFHQICLSLTAPGSWLICASCSASPNVATSAARAREASTDVQPLATPIQTASPATDAASHSAKPTAIYYSSKRRASTSSPSITPLSKAHCTNLTAVMDGMDQEYGQAPLTACSMRKSQSELLS